MVNEKFDTIAEVIQHRRTTKPDKMNGLIIPDAQIQSLLELADWAPTHGMTEPWRFIVYSGEGTKDFCRQHAELYRNYTAPENYIQANFDKLLHMGDTASHIIIAVMRRGDLPKIPVQEELAATACAVQNMLLGAAALNLAVYWGTGGMARHQAMKDFLNLRDEDIVTGILYFGYSDVQMTGKRTIPLPEKIRWIR